ncbi:hypothetical protein ASPWEDRAFT_55020 [Aspergillus wentii DTO 134E9]|uniref:Uncharacterized protein n=1 Tax=Aspergillus wentii DTO 134E9 TaxID=1073089 RepID=A0A1L9R684_ASPWE|nr:uncharacterized protein ASPWEDRAFT_55020 [Aspergillus wentii DTO 134E9]OJJ30432.1 hypothetical protein ASPWEDRAFT_55020 [Aspergillus wentii DTO 134E9]
MEESDPPRPTETPEDSAGGEDQGTKGATAKDRKCQYCKQAFTSSSLGRHLDQFLFKKKPDGLHNVEEIRRIRSGITRRQARTSSSKRDSPERELGKGQSEGENGKSKTGSVRMMFNTPTWHATGVINDIPSPGFPQANSLGPSSRFSSKSSQQPKQAGINLPDYASRGSTASSPDTLRALELALREVLDNIKAATSNMRPRMNPFEFDIQSQTFPSLCLQLLPPPPSLFATAPFPSPSSFPLSPPGIEHLDIVRQALRAKIEQWQSDQISSESPNASRSGNPGIGLDSSMISRNAQQHEDMSLRHLELAFKHWASLSPGAKQEAWQLEITRAFAREMEKRKSSDEQLARVQQEANQLRAQVERLGSCQWPREFALFPPDTLPLPRDVARELDAKESHINPNSPRWDYDSVVSKWKRVVMHDRSMGRIGVGYANTAVEDPTYADSATRPRVEEAGSSSRPTALQPPVALSPDQSSPYTGGGTSAPPSQNPSPYINNEASRSPNPDGPQAKRPRLMNGNHASEGAGSPSTAQSSSGPSNSNTWNSNQSLNVSNLAPPSGPTPPPSCSGT